MRRSPCHAVAASFDKAIEFSGAGEEKANRMFPQADWSFTILGCVAVSVKDESSCILPPDL